MLESIRNSSKGPVAKFIIALFVIPFAFTGVYSYFNAGAGNVVAVVNDSDISLREFERAYRTQQQNWGENFDRFFNTDERIQQFRNSVLTQLINSRLSSQAINEMGVRGSENKLRENILATPQFQDENGNFDLDRYRLVVESFGFTVEQYQAGVQSDMASNQFFTSLADSNFTLDHELTRHQILESQTRDIDFVVVPKASLIAERDFTTDEAQQEVSRYYELNQERFRIPEKVAISYLLLNKSDFMDVEISDEDVAAYYEENKDSFAGTERRRVAHILVNLPTDADEASITAATEKINAAKAQIDSGVAFETVVSEYSEDLISAEMGGDLDWIEAGMMDPSFEDAAFNLMDVGSVSDIVTTPFGFHLIKLLDLETGEAKPLEEIKAEIAQQMKEDLAEDNYFEAKEILAEQAFEFSDTLAEAASTLNKAVATTPLFDRQFGIGLPPELQGNPEVLEAAYSDEVLLDELNSEVIELNDDKAVVFRKAQYQEEGVRTLEQVQGQIQSILTDEAATELTREVADTIVTSLKDGATLESVVAGLDENLRILVWQTQSGLARLGTEVDVSIRDAAFQMDAEINTLDTISLANGDYAVIRLNNINVIEPDALLAASHAEKFNEFYQQAEISGYLKYLDTNANIERRLGNADIIQ